MIGVTIKSTLQNVKKCRLKYALSQNCLPSVDCREVFVLATQKQIPQ